MYKPPTALAVIVLLYAGTSVIGITWGLPTRDFDRFLFPDGNIWPGERVHKLVQADAKFAATLGADVDPDAIARAGDDPIPLNKTEADVAKIILRYRLYTYQPDEMITMMALAGMKPGELNFDPRLYQYGGLFIYPVGALLKLCDVVGLIDVHGDVAYYLDHPDEFGKFYVVARLYSAAWGLLGLFLVFAISRRLAGESAGLLAAAFFALMPVVMCMSHEGKPHLPGAVLMLAAVYFALRAVERDGGGQGSGVGGPGADAARNDVSEAQRTRRCFWFMCVCCGAALGMVLSSAPIFVLIPLVAWMMSPGCVDPRIPDRGGKPLSFPGRGAGALVTRRGEVRVETPSREKPPWASALSATAGGVAVALTVYLLSNPYIVINLFLNREVLRSNFGNSLAMYEISRLAEGFARVLELTVEGATLPVLVFGTLALLLAIVRNRKAALVLIVPAAVFFLQFVLIGAGKPAEYGRFGIFPNAALAIGTACLLGDAWANRRSLARGAAVVVLLVWVAIHGAAYLRNFRLDATDQGSRMLAAGKLLELAAKADAPPTIALLAEPAPYSCPPLDFAGWQVVLLRDEAQLADLDKSRLGILVHSVDLAPASEGAIQSAVSSRLSWLPQDTPISWANKPFLFRVEGGPSVEP